MFVLAIFLFVILYGGINVWIGWRAWQGLFQYLPLGAAWHPIYWILFAALAFSYVWGRMLQTYLPAALNRLIAYLGAYWLASLFYLIFMLLLIEGFRYLNRFLSILPHSLTARPAFSMIVGLLVLGCLSGILLYGTWNAQHPRIQHYALQISKSAGNIHDLHAVMVSDLHLGAINQNTQLNRLVKQVNALHPDLVLFAGDFFDENVEVFVKQKMATSLEALKAPYGVYAILGNHEYISGHPQEAMRYLSEAGITVLRDQMVDIAGNITLVGRDDISGIRFNGRKRADLSTLLHTVNTQRPILVLDHQPSHLEEAEQQGVDLQLSGHTHRGQLWPCQWITERLFATDWGLLVKGPFHLIVSDGYGTWGPPIRIGNHPEIVDLQIRFGS